MTVSLSLESARRMEPKSPFQKDVAAFEALVNQAIDANPGQHEWSITLNLPSLKDGGSIERLLSDDTKTAEFENSEHLRTLLTMLNGKLRPEVKLAAPSEIDISQVEDGSLNLRMMIREVKS